MIQGEKKKGKVVERFAGNRFLVELQSGETVKAYKAGRMNVNKISIDVGDNVEVLLDPAGGNATNRIIWRF